MQDAAVGEDPVREGLRLAYEATHARLWRSVLGFSGSREVADEAVAEAFAQALARGAALHDPEAWVWRAAFAIARGELARSRADRPALPEGAATPTPDLSLDLMAALQALNDADRQVVVLRHVGGWSAPEIAAHIGSTSAAVRVRLHRARAALRRELGGES